MRFAIPQHKYRSYSIGVIIAEQSVAHSKYDFNFQLINYNLENNKMLKLKMKLADEMNRCKNSVICGLWECCLYGFCNMIQICALAAEINKALLEISRTSMYISLNVNCAFVCNTLICEWGNLSFAYTCVRTST